jgi:hypothetical protein
MSPFQIRCFKQGAAFPANVFFILSKGRNTGRPSFEPNVNCFVFTCADTDDLHAYYWLVYALWAGNKFHPLLCGSVIEFIHLCDLKHLIETAALTAKNMDAIARSMKQIIQLENKLQQQITLIKQAKVATVRELIR